MAGAALRNKWSGLKQKLSWHDNSLSDEVSPELCVQLLKTLSFQTFSGLKSKLSRCSKDWLQEFVNQDGLCVLFNVLARLAGRQQTSLFDAIQQLECVNCIKVVLNSKTGLDSITNNPKLMHHLVGGGRTMFKT